MNSDVIQIIDGQHYLFGKSKDGRCYDRFLSGYTAVSSQFTLEVPPSIPPVSPATTGRILTYTIGILFESRFLIVLEPTSDGLSFNEFINYD